jgi:multidrug efflux pump subunit AcrA (membrane-fusion protein)
MRPERSVHVALLALLALGAGSCTGDDGPVLAFAEVRPGEVVEVVSAAAEVVAVDSADVIAFAGGEVVELLVEDGQQVAAGEVVARLSRDALTLRLAEIDAGLASARATIGDVTAAIGRYDTTEVEDRENLLARVEKLIGRARKADDEPLLTQYLAERDRLLAERDARAQLERQLHAARASVRQLSLAREQVVAGEGDLEVTSPIAGRIVLASASAAPIGAPAGDPIVVGMTVAPNQRIATVHDDSAQAIVADVDELDAPLVAVGQTVTVTVDALTGVELEGRVVDIDLLPVREATGGAVYPTRIELVRVPSDVRLLLGLTASVDITVRTVRAETLVPTFALVRRGGIDVVYVVRDGVAVEVPVVVTAFGDDDAAVEGDLAVGERVVVSGLDTIEDGTAVEDDAGTAGGQG